MPTESLSDDTADHAVTLGIPRIRPQPIAPASIPPPLPDLARRPAPSEKASPTAKAAPPRRESSPITDLPTQHLFISPGLSKRLNEQHGRLTAPESWSEDEGTAALLLPLAEPPAGPGEIARPAAIRLPTPEAPPVRSAGAYLLTGAVGGALMLLALLGGEQLWRALPTGRSPTTVALADAEQRRLVDDALVAVQGGHLDQALAQLTRARQLIVDRGQQPDPTLELFLAALKSRQPQPTKH
jgi:hypothetical protein